MPKGYTTKPRVGNESLTVNGLKPDPPSRQSKTVRPSLEATKKFIDSFLLSEADLDKEVKDRAEKMQAVDFDIFDRKNPNSLVNKTDSVTSQQIAKIPQRWTYNTESRISEVANPDDVLMRLRLSFWEEYNRAVRTGEIMSRGRICYGICALGYWKREVLNSWKALVYVIRPPRHEMYLHKTLMLHGYDRIYEILKMPIHVDITRNSKEELASGKVKSTTTKYKKVDMAAIRAIRDTMRMLINTQSYYVIAGKFGRDEAKAPGPGRRNVRKQNPNTYPDQDVPRPPDEPLVDPQELEDEIEELEGKYEEEQEAYAEEDDGTCRVRQRESILEPGVDNRRKREE